MDTNHTRLQENYERLQQETAAGHTAAQEKTTKLEAATQIARDELVAKLQAAEVRRFSFHYMERPVVHNCNFNAWCCRILRKQRTIVTKKHANAWKDRDCVQIAAHKSQS